MPHKPEWFRDGEVFMSFAETCGINKDGNVLYEVDSSTGKRTNVIDDKLSADIDALLKGEPSPAGRWIEIDRASIGAPMYYDTRYDTAMKDFVADPDMAGFTIRTLGSLIKEGLLWQRAGHGSPSADRRGGDIPYIKVSDVRAGQININPTNLVSSVVAKSFWKGDTSGLKEFDLVTPIRASKNIGEFAVVMSGQEQIVLTKEMLVLRATDKAPVDNFYLLWALSLKVVRQQWKRIVLMQTNREDVGKRYLEIQIPWPPNEARATKVSAAFRTYYKGMEELRSKFIGELVTNDRHHVFLGRVREAPGDDLDDESEVPEVEE